MSSNLFVVLLFHQLLKQVIIILKLGGFLNLLGSLFDHPWAHYNPRILDFKPLKLLLGWLPIRYHIHFELFQAATVAQHDLVVGLCLLDPIGFTSQRKAVNHRNHILLVVSDSDEGASQTLTILFVLVPLGQFFASHHNLDEVWKLDWLAVYDVSVDGGFCGEALLLRLGRVFWVGVDHDRALPRFSFAFSQSFIFKSIFFVGALVW